jgi:hypothetical protein
MLKYSLVIYKSFKSLSQFSAESKNGKYDERGPAPGPEAERTRCVSRWIQIWYFGKNWDPDYGAQNLESCKEFV